MRWHQLGITSLEGAHHRLGLTAATLSRQTGRAIEAPLPGGYIDPELQERTVNWLDPLGQLQEAILTADRDALERGVRARSARAHARGGNARAE
eukprot:1770529-Pyramimonas_sp.AAC.1